MSIVTVILILYAIAAQVINCLDGLFSPESETWWRILSFLATIGWALMAHEFLGAI